jgi:hypothetical protein
MQNALQTRAALGGNPNSPDEDPLGDENEILQHRLQDQLRQAQVDADKLTKND